jgi:hypothetical protein
MTLTLELPQTQDVGGSRAGVGLRIGCGASSQATSTLSGSAGVSPLTQPISPAIPSESE